MTSEFMKRGTTFEGPAITMLRLRTSTLIPGLAQAAGSARIWRLPRLGSASRFHIAFHGRLKQHDGRIRYSIFLGLEARQEDPDHR